MLKKITASTVVVTIMSLSSTARADDYSWITLGQRPSCVSPEVHAPIERFIVGAAVIEARVWKGEIKPGERARRHLDNARNATRLPFESGDLDSRSIIRKYIKPLWVR